MEEQLMKKVFVVGSIMSAAAIMVMALYLYGRNQIDLLTSMLQREARAESTEATEISKVYLGIPLPEGTVESDISAENCYMKQSIIVTIQNAAADFYDGQVLGGSSKHIRAVYYDTEAQAVRIHVMLDELCEYDMSLHQNELQMSFIPVHEMYDKVVVIDVGHGGASSGTVSYGISEKDVALQIANQLKRLLDQTDIRVYYTRLSDTDVSQEERIQFAALSGADMYISLHTNADADSHVTAGVTTYYDTNDTESKLTNQALAELVQGSVLSATKAEDKGAIEDSNGIKLLRNIEIPAVMLETGYMTNRQEALLMASAPYQEKVAKGLYDGIVKAYKKFGKTINRVTEDE